LFTRHGNAVIPFAAAGLGVALYTLFHPGVRRGSLADGESDDRVPDREIAAEGATSGVGRDGDVDGAADGLAEVISIDEGDRQRAVRPVADPKRRRG
jgi:hypothetical protein